MKCCWKRFFFLLGTVFLIRWQNLLKSYVLKSLDGSLPSFYCLHGSINQFQPPNNWPAETGTVLFLLGLFSGKKLAFATAVSLSVSDREVDTSFAHAADGHARAVAGPKSLWLGSGWEMWSPWEGVGLVCGQVLLLSTLGMGWVFPTESMESESCAKAVGFWEQSYCILSGTVGLEQFSSAKLWKLQCVLPVTKPPQFVHYQSIFGFNHMLCFCLTLIFPHIAAFFEFGVDGNTHTEPHSLFSVINSVIFNVNISCWIFQTHFWNTKSSSPVWHGTFLHSFQKCLEEKREQFLPLRETIHLLLWGIVWNKQIELAHRKIPVNNSSKTVSFSFVQYQAYGDESCEISRVTAVPIVLTFNFWSVTGFFFFFSSCFSKTKGSMVGGPVEIYLQKNPSAGEIRLMHTSVDKTCASLPWGWWDLQILKSAVVTLLSEEEADHAVTSSKGRTVFKCHLQLLSVQSGCFLAEKGWALVSWIQSEKDGILLNLGNLLSSDCQDQYRASAGRCAGNMGGPSAGLAQDSGYLLWCHLADTKSSPSVNRAGEHFWHAEWAYATSVSENVHQNAESCALGPERWHPRKQSLLGHRLVGGLGEKHGVFSTSEGVLFGADGENWIIF